MLRFSDFSHLAEVDELVRRLTLEQSGLILVAGLDSRPGGPDPEGGSKFPQFLPSGRATIFRVLVSEMLDAQPKSRCLVVAEDKDVLHVARRFRSRIELLQVRAPTTYEEVISQAAKRRPGMLVVDRVAPHNLAPLLAATRDGGLVVTQLDTIYHAQAVARHLVDWGAMEDDLAGLRWVISVQRLPALCPICKQPAEVTSDLLARLETLGRRFPTLAAVHAPPDGGAFYAPVGCPKCQFTGRQGDIAAFDFLFAGDPGEDFWNRPSLMPVEAYVWMLAQRGQLALADALNFESNQLRRTYALLMNRERQLAETTAALERKTVELNSANSLLKQRTRELISLEGIGQALITWNDLRELGDRVLKTALELSKADRGILYYLRSAEWGQILASRGWREAQEEIGLSRGVIYENLSDRESAVYLGSPPGVDVPPDVPPLRAGLAVPLIAHGIPAGLMLVQSTRRNQFTPGEVAILQTLAGYAAVAMQRAGLVEQLQGKIEALEQAQEDLAQKERLERELELARQVQQSMLPRTFPDMPGVTFSAAYEPARQVGGDFYDVIRLDDARVGLVIADVSDKGMPAALYMALSRSLILAESRQSDSPAMVLRNVNELLLELGEQDMFVTVFYGVLDTQTGRLTYARAGHDHPFLVRDGRVSPLEGRGLALGLFDAGMFTVTEETLALRSGDLLVLYTDGLTDIIGADGEMIAREQLVEILLSHNGKSPALLCRALFEDLLRIRGDKPQFDDMALVIAAVD